MILVKTNSINTKSKVKKFDLITNFEPEDIHFVSDEEIECKKLLKMSNEKIEILNKKLEKCRLIMRAIECSFNNSGLLKNKSDLFENMVRVRTKGKFYKTIDSENGIFIH